jgi:RNA polymerase sigma-70 factor (ECF subfamily)
MVSLTRAQQASRRESLQVTSILLAGTDDVPAAPLRPVARFSKFPIVRQPGRLGAGKAPDGRAGEGGHVPGTLELIELEIPRLRRYARYLARDADRADDLVQECLTRAIAKVDSWTPGTNLRAWLFVILRNCHINEVRRGQRTSLIGEASSDYEVVPTPASQESHINLLEVRDAYLNLSEEHREVLLLVAIEGLQYEEAAAILEVPVGTIRSRLSRARQALRDALDDRLITPRGPVSRARETRHG